MDHKVTRQNIQTFLRNITIRGFLKFYLNLILFRGKGIESQTLDISNYELCWIV